MTPWDEPQAELVVFFHCILNLYFCASYLGKSIVVTVLHLLSLKAISPLMDSDCQILLSYIHWQPLFYHPDVR